ncbi:hypothetical protein LXL04_030541 [Taraxacum kok-saghyz]
MHAKVADYRGEDGGQFQWRVSIRGGVIKNKLSIYIFKWATYNWWMGLIRGAKELWCKLVWWCQIALPMFVDVEEMWSWIEIQHRSRVHKVILEVLFGSLLWVIWTYRNAVVFGDGSIIHLIDELQSIELASGELEIIRLRQGNTVVSVLARVGDEIQIRCIPQELYAFCSIQNMRHDNRFRAPHSLEFELPASPSLLTAASSLYLLRRRFSQPRVRATCFAVASQFSQPTVSTSTCLTVSGKWVKNIKPTGSNPKPTVSNPNLSVCGFNPQTRETEFRTQETEPAQKPSSLGSKTQKPTQTDPCSALIKRGDSPDFYVNIFQGSLFLGKLRFFFDQNLCLSTFAPLQRRYVKQETQKRAKVVAPDDVVDTSRCPIPCDPRFKMELGFEMEIVGLPESTSKKSKDELPLDSSSSRNQHPKKWHILV